MLINTLVGLFCTFISKQSIILSVGYKWSHCLNWFPSASSWVGQINSDSVAAQISTALVKVKSEETWLLDSWHRLHHTCRVRGRVGRCLYWCHFPMVAPICRSVQLPFIYLNLSAILVPSGLFSCRTQVSYHILVFYFTTKQGQQDWPNVSMTLVPRPIKPVASSAARVYYF